MPYDESSDINRLIAGSQRILIMQADNPDGDSLGSALALEHIIGDMGKEPLLYCGVHIPDYLHYLPGWDRVSNELPGQFDLSIIVDTSADSLFETLNKSGFRSRVAGKPCIVIDHHAVENTIDYAAVICNKPVVATGQIIYELAAQLGWTLNSEAKSMIAVSIMSDSLGLVSEGTSARSIHIIGELVEGGVNLALLENARRVLMRKSAELTNYKGQLLQRIEYHADGRIAVIHVPWEEIERYSQAYNPSMLVIDDMRSTLGVDVAIAFKTYNDGHITAKIRCNYGKTIAGELAKQFGGGGHPYASGFKVNDGRSYQSVKDACITAGTELLNALE